MFSSASVGNTSKAALRPLVECPSSSRPLRMAIIIGALWLTNAFDVTMTLVAHGQGVLHETNPVGVWLLNVGPPALFLYKFTMVLIGTTLLWRVHRHPIAESTAWMILGIYVIVAMRWCDYYDVYLALGNLDLVHSLNVPI